MIVLDANILIRAVLGRRVRQILDSYSGVVGFYAPDVAFSDARRYAPILLQRRNKPTSDTLPALDYLQRVIELVDAETYGELEADARQRLANRDEEDWPVIATALALNCPIWTEDADFFGTGVAVWTTSRIEIYLRKFLTGRM